MKTARQTIDRITYRHRKKKLRAEIKEIASQFIQNKRLIERSVALKMEQKKLLKKFNVLRDELKTLEENSDDPAEPNSLEQLCLE
ncbi:MAG: hypothetical protein WC119_01440 [Synergistaceae bacterium]